MKRLRLLAFGLLALPAIVSCDNNDVPLTEIADREIALGLSLDRLISSRASIDAGMLDGENYIINGEYGIIMNLDSYKNRAHCCRFGTSVLDNGRRGNIYLVDALGSPSAAPLKWTDVGVKSFDFTIDNLGYTEELGRAWTDEEKTVTYAAQKESYDQSGQPGHTNDIIWGSGKAQYGDDGKDVSYAELTHRMTRISVAFVNLTEQQQKDMTVTLTNLVLEPEGFDRADGTVAIAENPERRKYQLVSEDEKLNEIRDETAEGYVEHVTANHILPPQALLEEHWPEIVVTYTDEAGQPREVRGLIPHDILNEDGNTWEALDGLNAGNHLTIVAEIKDDIPDIVFTAKVRKWVDLGPVTVTANQYDGTPGICSMEKLKHCIELYNDLPQFDRPDSWNNASFAQRLTHFGELMRYGDCRRDDNGCIAWTFNIDFELTEEDLPQTRFRYMLCRLLENANNENEYKDLSNYIYPLNFVYKPDESLNEAVKTKLMGQKGIYNIEDLNHMIKAVNERNISFMLFYGLANKDWVNSQWIYTIDIRADLSGDILDKLNLEDLKYGDDPIKVVVNPNGFKLNGEENIGEQIGIQ